MKVNCKKLFVVFLAACLAVSSMMVFANVDELYGEPEPKVTEEAKTIEIKKIMDSDGNKLFDSLESKLAEASDSDELPVIVVYNENINSDNKAKVKGLTGNKKAKHEYDIIPGMALSLTKKEIKELAKQDFVKQIEYDEPVHATLDSATYWIGAQAARAQFGVDGNADGSAGYSKNDIVVAVIDTGIDASHPDLDGGKIIGWMDLINAQSTPYDDNGHGTHCSSIVAGTGEGNSAYTGVAPGAALVGVKVLDGNGSGTMSSVAAGINWVVNNKNTYGIEVISLSLGTSGSSDGTDAVSVAVNNAFNAGIVVCTVAGNEGPGTYTIGSPGAATYGLTVGSMADVGEGGFYLCSSSGRGPTADNRIKPDIVAPGYMITAAGIDLSGGYVTLSGTSVTAPLAAGTVALIFDADPTLTASDAVDIITGSAEDWGPPGKDIDYGYGRLNAFEAVKCAGGYADINIPLPVHMYRAETLDAVRVSDYWTFNVTNTSYPIAITMIMPNWTSSQDFDLYLYNPSGTQVKSSSGSTRQETISFKPTVTGTYTLRAYSYAGTGNYFFDLSAGVSNLILTIDN